MLLIICRQFPLKFPSCGTADAALFLILELYCLFAILHFCIFWLQVAIRGENISLKANECDCSQCQGYSTDVLDYGPGNQFGLVKLFCCHYRQNLKNRISRSAHNYYAKSLTTFAALFTQNMCKCFTDSLIENM